MLASAPLNVEMWYNSPSVRELIRRFTEVSFNPATTSTKGHMMELLSVVEPLESGTIPPNAFHSVSYQNEAPRFAGRKADTC